MEVKISDAWNEDIRTKAIGMIERLRAKGYTAYWQCDYGGVEIRVGPAIGSVVLCPAVLRDHTPDELPKFEESLVVAAEALIALR